MRVYGRRQTDTIITDLIARSQPHHFFIKKSSNPTMMSGMTTTAFVLLIIAACTLPSATAFAPAAPSLLGVRTSTSHSVPRSLPIVQSAKVLPFAYSSLSAALIFRATKAATTADAVVLVATSALAFFNLGPTDNTRLASAKKADKNTPPASSGKAKQLRQAAKTWRSVVRIKLIGQIVGLFWMVSAKSGTGVLRGGATVMAANMAFFLCGAGRATHDADGAPAPMPPSLSSTILTVDTVLTVAALVGASSPIESARRTVFAGIFAVGASIGALEGLVTILLSMRK